MNTDKHLRKYLKDYQPPDFSISETQLEFHLEAGCTRVLSRLKMHRMSADQSVPLVLDGIQLNLLELRLDGRLLSPDEFEVGEETLVIQQVPDHFELSCQVEIDPAAKYAPRRPLPFQW